MACPRCAQPSEHIHSHYQRRLRDLPSQGQPVMLHVQARRFRCLNPACPLKTFSELLSGTARPSARRTERLADRQCHLGLSLGGEAGMRLAERLAMPVSADTLLRLVGRAGRTNIQPALTSGLGERHSMRGRKPVAATLRTPHGSPRVLAMPKFEPKPAGDLIDAPDWLSEGQRTSWTYVLTNAPPDLWKHIDRGALLAWVVTEDLHCQAAIAQSKVGLLVPIKAKASSGHDDPGGSPYINIIKQQAKIMLKAAAELGFMAVSRPRIAAGAPLLSVAPDWSISDSQQNPKLSLDEFLASKTTHQVKR